MADTAVARVEGAEDVAALRRRIKKLENRQKQADAHAAWQQSWTRTALICAATYAVLAPYMCLAQLNDAWVGAVVPTVAYALSTFQLPAARRAWAARVARGSDSIHNSPA